MWDRPELMNRTANVLYAIAVVLAAYGLVWVTVQLPVFALRQIEMTGATHYITRAQVQKIVEGEMKGTFFTLNLPAVRRAFEKLPWVREVNLRRHWPDRLEVTVIEHVALARWGNTALVNTHGEVFEARYEGKLPVFIGPAGTAKEIAIQYDLFRRHLAVLSAAPAAVRLTPRRAWQVRVEGGPTLELGRENVEARLVRYVQLHASTIAPLKRHIEYVDLRYANGFAVRIPELKGVEGKSERAVVKPKVKGI